MMLAATIVCPAFAEVQNVRVTGEVRIRGNYSENLADLNDDVSSSYDYFDTRALVGVSADLSENVFAHVELDAYGIAGISGTALTRDDDSFDVKLSQGYIKLAEMFSSPVDLKIGRQYLNYGHGLLISSNEKEYKFDAAKLVGHFGDFQVDLLAAKLNETLNLKKDKDLFGGNVAYNAETWNAEAYVFGFSDKSKASDAGLNGAGLAKFDVDADPIYVGLRSDVAAMENFDLWGEVVYQTGTYKETDLSAFAIDAGTEYSFADVAWMPSIKLAYTYAQGDKDMDDPKDLFVAPYNYTYYGYVYSPYVSNIHILNAKFSVVPVENLTLSVDYYHYAQDAKLATSVGNPDIDNGGVSAMTNGLNKTLGNEIDVVASYNYTQDVMTQIYAGWFLPGKAYSSPGDDTAFEIRGEIVVNF